jgi:SAM-dependent methyltransferase
MARVQRTFATRTSPPLTFAAWLRHDTIQALLSRVDSVERVLEIGPGAGAFAVRLASAFDYVGVEPDPAGFAQTHKRLARLGCGTIVRGLDGLATERLFDLVCAFEVLEHIADDRAALAQWRGLLRPRGWLLISVPAGSERFGPADRRVGHYRRYDASRLQRLLREDGFDVCRIETVGMPLGFLLEALRHLIATLSRTTPMADASTGSGSFWLQPPQSLSWLTRALTAPFRAVERRLPQHHPGTNLIILASRRD